MRFERKYRITLQSLAEVKQMLALHPAGFREHHADRQVNNIYFDNTDLLTYHLNTSGVGSRKKYRVRWYGENPSEIVNPIFETKIKQNELGSKRLIPVQPFSLNKLSPLTEEVNQQNPDLIALFPVLLNSYQRAYLISADGRYRATLDFNMQY
ncbi:MAG: VTC domain-containing protein, partial [Bacteroidia bacterium]